jgi:hypothetical protein
MGTHVTERQAWFHQETSVHLLIVGPNKSPTYLSFLIYKKNNYITFQLKLCLTMILELGVWKSRQMRSKMPNIFSLVKEHAHPTPHQPTLGFWIYF